MKMTSTDIQQNGMPNRNRQIDNYLEKIAHWKKTITLRIERNLEMKEILSDILRNQYKQIFLESIENFQTDFLEVEETYRKLGEELERLQYSLIKLWARPDYSKASTLIADEMKMMNQKIEDSEKQFREICSAFKKFQKENRLKKYLP